MTLHCALAASFAHSPPHHWFQVGLPKVSVLPEIGGSHPSVGSAGQASGLEAWHGSKTQTNSHSNASCRCQLMAAVRPEERTTRFSSGRTAPTRQQSTCFASESRETKRIICVRPATRPGLTHCSGHRWLHYLPQLSAVVVLLETATVPGQLSHARVSKIR